MVPGIDEVESHYDPVGLGRTRLAEHESRIVQCGGKPRRALVHHSGHADRRSVGLHLCDPCAVVGGYLVVPQDIQHGGHYLFYIYASFSVVADDRASGDCRVEQRIEQMQGQFAGTGHDDLKCLRVPVGLREAALDGHGMFVLPAERVFESRRYLSVYLQRALPVVSSAEGAPLQREIHRDLLSLRSVVGPPSGPVSDSKRVIVVYIHRRPEMEMLKVSVLRRAEHIRYIVIPEQEYIVLYLYHIPELLITYADIVDYLQMKFKCCRIFSPIRRVLYAFFH